MAVFRTPSNFLVFKVSTPFPELAVDSKIKHSTVHGTLRLMETANDTKSVSNIGVSDDGKRQFTVNAHHAGRLALIPLPSNDPLDPLVCAVLDSHRLKQGSFLNSILELADQQETQDPRRYLARYIFGVLSMPCRSITGCPAIKALPYDYYSDGISGILYFQRSA